MPYRVVGTGASAIQFLPPAARTARRVDVYQRSAPQVLPKTDRPCGAAQQPAVDRVPGVRKTGQLRSQIADPELRAKCVPGYAVGCKRVNNRPDHTFRYQYRLRRFQLSCYRAMPSWPATPGARAA